MLQNIWRLINLNENEYAISFSFKETLSDMQNTKVIRGPRIMEFLVAVIYTVSYSISARTFFQ